MNTRPWEIYALSDPRTGKVRYVGVTFRGKARFNEHLSRAVTGGRTHRDCWVRSLLAVGLRPSYGVLERGAGPGWEDSERRWIAELKPTTELTNHTDGGEGFSGYVPTPELRRKWSAMRRGVKYPPGRRSAMLGRKHSAVAVEKIRRALFGRKLSDSARAKVAAARRGKPLTPEHVEKLAAAKRGKKHSEEHNRKIAAATTNRKPVVCVETGQVFASITATARTLGVTESSVNQAIRKGCCCKGNHYRLA